MKILKIAVIVLSITTLSQCKSVKLENNTPFTIYSATYYNATTDLHKNGESKIYIRYSSKDKIVFDSLYFRNKKVKVELKTMRGLKYVFGEFRKKLILNDVILDINPVKELKNKLPKSEKFPFKLSKNEAIISYLLEGKTYYYKVKGIKTVQSNPF